MNTLSPLRQTLADAIDRARLQAIVILTRINPVRKRSDT